MPARDPAVRAASARLAAEERHHPDADHTDLRRALYAAQTAASLRQTATYLRELSGELTSEQRGQLAVAVLAPEHDGGPA
jgi:hypothetical protein